MIKYSSIDGMQKFLTPLHEAAKHGHTELVALLTETYKADPNMESKVSEDTGSNRKKVSKKDERLYVRIDTVWENATSLCLSRRILENSNHSNREWRFRGNRRCGKWREKPKQNTKDELVQRGRAFFFFFNFLVYSTFKFFERWCSWGIHRFTLLLKLVSWKW